MGKAMEIISGQATAPGAVLTNLTMNAGNSLEIRYASKDSKILLADIFGKHQAAGRIQVRSPQLHDNRQGINLFDPIGLSLPLVPEEMVQPLVTQDTLVVQTDGSAVAGDIETASLVICYADLIGIDADLRHYEEIKDRIVDIMCVENTLATGAAGGWSGEELITAEFDNWKADTKYALLGYNVSVLCGAVRWIGSDVGNLGVGGPGNPEHKELTSRYFVHLNQKTGMPTIPVFNSQNKGAIFVSAHQDENGVDVLLTSIFAELSE